MDLKIASICLVHDGLLLTRSLSDFEKVRFQHFSFSAFQLLPVLIRSAATTRKGLKSEADPNGA
jgi:hypothetical protein